MEDDNDYSEPDLADIYGPEDGADDELEHEFWNDIDAEPPWDSDDDEAEN